MNCNLMESFVKGEDIKSPCHFKQIYHLFLSHFGIMKSENELVNR